VEDETDCQSHNDASSGRNHNVKPYLAAGIADLQLEDQVVNKRRGAVEEVFLSCIRAAMLARYHRAQTGAENVVFIAQTDAPQSLSTRL
jgi:2-methylisocitrate lyase-like PEP mutase family enzyme